MQLQWLNINNRRYIGSKTKLLSNINDVIKNYYKDNNFVFYDPFAGTGVVADFYSQKGCKVIANDLLFSNFVAYNTWIKNGQFDINKISQYLCKYNELVPEKIEENYVSKYFGNKYYHVNDAKLIGHIREDIENNKEKLSLKEYYILLTSLMYEADKVANTCGHFESFLNKEPIENGIELRMPKITSDHKNNEVYCEDANQLSKKIISDVTYIDPPYNARQYVNFYHVLENIMRWEKPTDFEGNSMKFKRNHLKSDYSKSKAPLVMQDLIDNLNTKLIVVSYNNTYNARSGASNNKTTEEQLFEILSSKGKTDRVEIDYKAFNAGKTDLNNHKEYLYFCEVK